MSRANPGAFSSLYCSFKIPTEEERTLAGNPVPSARSTPIRRSAVAAATKPTPLTQVNVLPSAAPEDEAAFADSRLVVSGRVTLENGAPASSAAVSLLETDFTGGGNPPKLVRETSTSLTGDYRVAARNVPTVLVKAVQPGYASDSAFVVDNKTANMGKLTGSRYEIRNLVLPPAAARSRWAPTTTKRSRTRSRSKPARRCGWRTCSRKTQGGQAVE
jgi:hypothetical protein